MKCLKGRGIVSGGALVRKRIVAMGFCYHGNHYVVIATKDVHFQVNQSTIRNMLDLTMMSLATWVTSTDNVTSHWPISIVTS